MRLVNICTGKVTKTQSWRRKPFLSSHVHGGIDGIFDSLVHEDVLLLPTQDKLPRAEVSSDPNEDGSMLFIY